MKLLIYATGTLNTCFLPFAINWIKAKRPADRIQVVLSQSADTFVSAKSLSALTGNPVPVDSWTDPTMALLSATPHTWLAQHDGVLIYPASLNTVCKVRNMDAGTPFLNSVQCTTAPIVIAPNLPPGAGENPAVQAVLDELRLRNRMTVIEPVARPSISVDADALVAPPIWDCMEPFRTPDASVAREVAFA